ncbi:MAG: NAD(P)H-dependent oxidoreductase [Proteobacteria bacterium]|nr:NAD(P)H-dependent oxidoreductase [Pseudomonadota bacterium]
MTAVRILLVTGSTRSASTNTAALRTAQACAPPGVIATLHDALAALPAFNPDHDHEPLPGPVAVLRAEIASNDALVFCTPEYAGALPGSFKNLLDWTVGGTQLSGKPVAWLNVAAPGRGEHAVASLRGVLGYVTATILDDCCIRVGVGHDALGPDGLVRDPDVRARLAQVLADVATHVRSR